MLKTSSNTDSELINALYFTSPNTKIATWQSGVHC